MAHQTAHAKKLSKLFVTPLASRDDLMFLVLFVAGILAVLLPGLWMAPALWILHPYFDQWQNGWAFEYMLSMSLMVVAYGAVFALTAVLLQKAGLHINRRHLRSTTLMMILAAVTIVAIESQAYRLEMVNQGGPMYQSAIAALFGIAYVGGALMLRRK